MRSPLISLAVAIASVAAQSPLTTTLAGSGFLAPGGSVQFDLVVSTPVAITRIDVDALNGVGTVAELSVLTTPGGRSGRQTSRLLWSGPAATAAATAAGVNSPTVCMLQPPLVLPVGTWGMSLQSDLLQLGTDYPTNQTYATAELQLVGGDFTVPGFRLPVSGPVLPAVSLHYGAAIPGTRFATTTNYQDGCVRSTARGFYEYLSAAAFDLDPPGIGSMTLLHTGLGYLGLAGLATFVPPSSLAQALVLGDNETMALNISVPMPVGADATTTQLFVNSNGIVSTGEITDVPLPVLYFMSNFDIPAWYSWHDYDPAAGGTVWFEDLGNMVYVTWDGVPTHGFAQGETLQFQLDTTTGDVSIVWVSISGNGGHHLVGYTDRRYANLIPIDISAVLPHAVNDIATFHLEPLSLTTAGRPFAGAPLAMAVDGITAATLLGTVAFGLTQLPQPLNLAAYGMPGCRQYCDQLAFVPFVPNGGSAAQVPLTVPNMVGLDLQAQAFTYAPASARTPLGALASNGTLLQIGDW